MQRSNAQVSTRSLSFQLCGCRNLKQIRHTTAFLEHDILLATDENPAAGLNYHLADVWVPELVGVCQAGARAPSKALRQLLEPLCQAMAQTQRPAFMQRIRCAQQMSGPQDFALGCAQPAICWGSGSTQLPKQRWKYRFWVLHTVWRHISAWPPTCRICAAAMGRSRWSQRSSGTPQSTTRSST